MPLLPVEAEQPVPVHNMAYAHQGTERGQVPTNSNGCCDCKTDGDVTKCNSICCTCNMDCNKGTRCDSLCYACQFDGHSCRYSFCSQLGSLTAWVRGHWPAF
jgi:hypothetical protein